MHLVRSSQKGDCRLDDPFLPTGGGITEIRLEQVVRDHGVEAGVDDAAVTLANLVDGGLHVVIDTACSRRLNNDPGRTAVF